MPLTYLAVLFSSLVAIKCPASRGPSICLDKSGRGREGCYQLNSDSIGRSGVKARAGTLRVLTLILLSKKAGISLNKPRVCCKLKKQSSYAFTLRRLTAQSVKGTYVDTSSLPHTAIGQGRQG